MTCHKMRNSEGYPDPTANKAISKGWEKARAQKVLRMIEAILFRNEFKLDSIRFISERTGETYKVGK